MANRTDVEAKNIHGLNPQNLIEKITREKIYASVYWKKDCFGLSAETLVDKAVALRCVGGMMGEPQKPCEFMCLVLKMLQIQPDKEIIIEFIKNDDYKYVRLLGAYYLRLVGRAYDVYTYLEPLYNDFRRVRVAQPSGRYALAHVDEVVDDMLRKDYLFDVALPHIPMRHLLEKAGTLEPRVSLLDAEEVEAAIAAAEQEAAAAEQEAAAAKQQLKEAGGAGGGGGSAAAGRAPPKAHSSGADHVERTNGRGSGRGGRGEADSERDRTHERERDRDRDRDRERERERDRRDDRERGRERDERRDRYDSSSRRGGDDDYYSRSSRGHRDHRSPDRHYSDRRSERRGYERGGDQEQQLQRGRRRDSRSRSRGRNNSSSRSRSRERDRRR